MNKSFFETRNLLGLSEYQVFICSKPQLSPYNNMPTIVAVNKQARVPPMSALKPS
jgi:hypothetical protein